MKTKNIYKSLKAHVAVFAAVAFAMSFHSCEQFDLDEDVNKQQLSVLPYESAAEMELAVVGAYDRMWDGFRQTTGVVVAWGGDDITTHRASNKADFREYDQRNVTSANTRLSSNWARKYGAVRAANTVILNAEETQLTDQALQNNLLGQAHFIRAIIYLDLTRMYGEIPLVTGITPDLEISVSSQPAIYAQIESDLLFAESVLPASTNEGTTRPSSGSARAMLARLYMDWAGWPIKDTSKYAQAAASAKQVIDNAGAHGFALVPDMATLYTLAGSLNSECVFCVSFCDPCGRPNLKNGKLGLPGDFGGWQESFAEIRFFEDMPEGPRKDATYHRVIPLDADGAVTADVANAATLLPWTEFKDQQNPVFRKLVGPFEDNVFNGFRTSRADYLLRYAEVLLIYAEASGRAGTVSADAWAALNQVRTRAGLPNVSAADGAIEELTYTERKWELAGEYQRWNDLVRLERVEQALGNRNPQVSIGTAFDADGNPTPKPLTEASNPIKGSLGTDNYHHPLPPAEVDQLPNISN